MAKLGSLGFPESGHRGASTETENNPAEAAIYRRGGSWVESLELKAENVAWRFGVRLECIVWGLTGGLMGFESAQVIWVQS